MVIHALGGAYLVAAGIIFGVLSSMLAIWILFVGLGLELEGCGPVVLSTPVRREHLDERRILDRPSTMEETRVGRGFLPRH